MNTKLLLSKLPKLTFMLAFPFLLSESVHGQCLTNVDQYPSSTVVPTFFDGVTPNEISSCNYEEEYAVVQVNANQYHVFYSSNPNTYITISNNGGVSAVAHGQGQVAYTSTTAGTIRVYFNANATCGTYDDCIVTNVLIGPIPTCFTPLGITYSNLTNTGINLAWSAPSPAPSGGYEYYYGAPSTPPTSSTTPSGTSATPSASLSTLTQNMDYGFWVRSVCGTSDKSNWSMMKAFTTQHVVSRPWTEEFTVNMTIPDGFTADENYWFVDSDPGYFDGNPGDFLGLNQYLPGMQQFETVNISGVQGSDSLKFDYRYFDAWDAPLAPPANDGYFKVYISSNFGQTYTQIDSINNNTAAVWTTKAYPLTAYAGQTIRVKIESYYSSPSGFGDYFIGFDNLFVGGSNCTPPVVNLGADTAICDGGSITLNAGTHTGATYTWSNGASTTATNTINAAGTYWVKVTTAANCEATDTIIVSERPLPSATAISVTNNSPEFEFTVTGAQNTNSYAWNFGDGGSATGQSSSHTYTANGNYTVTVTLTNACGSTNLTQSVSVTGVSVHNTDLEGKQIKLYPNPAKNSITVENLSHQNMKSVTVYNILGQKMELVKVAGAKNAALNLSKYANGIYSMVIEFENGTVSRKFEVLK